MAEYNRVVTQFKNGITEVKTYEYYQRIGYSVVREKNTHQSLVTFKSELGRKKGKKENFNEVNVYKNVLRAKKKIRELCNENYDILTKFLTLTFAGNFTEDRINDANKILSKFLKRLAYKYKIKVEYLCVPELQKNGKIHFHLLCNLPYIDIVELESIWQYGIVHITKIDDIRNLGAYLSSYIDKDFGKCFQGRKHFFKSKGVVYPTSIKLDSEKDNTNYDITECVYSSENENAFCGTVHTNIYDKNNKWK